MFSHDVCSTINVLALIIQSEIYTIKRIALPGTFYFFIFIFWENWLKRIKISIEIKRNKIYWRIRVKILCLPWPDSGVFLLRRLNKTRICSRHLSKIFAVIWHTKGQLYRYEKKTSKILMQFQTKEKFRKKCHIC